MGQPLGGFGSWGLQAAQPVINTSGPTSGWHLPCANPPAPQARDTGLQLSSSSLSAGSSHLLSRLSGPFEE